MLIITFSGLDGCGKSTQVALTAEYLCQNGLRVREFVTQAAAATQVFARWRLRVRSCLGLVRRFRPALPASAHATSAKPTPARPIPARAGPPVQTYARGRSFDQDRRHWFVRLRRTIAYPLDCIVLSARLLAARTLGYDAVVCDRYIYDKMLGLPRPDCFVSRLMCKLVPRPDFAFFLDTPPDVSHERDLEHQKDYYDAKYAGYQQVMRMDCGLRPIHSTTARQTQERIRDAVGNAVRESRPPVPSYDTCGTEPRP